MQLKTLFACATFIATSIAQSSQTKIAFTQLPTAVQAGKPVTLQWGGGTGAVGLLSCLPILNDLLTTSPNSL